MRCSNPRAMDGSVHEGGDFHFINSQRGPRKQQTTELDVNAGIASHEINVALIRL